MPQSNVSQSTADDSNDSRALKTKAIPPTFINLTDCKPILSTTSTNTSSNSSANGTTAFVFTSSRTLRALQDEETSSFYAGSSPSPPLASPSTPSTTVSDSSSHLARSRASLTLSQLVRHSDGAVDARSLLGPKMRAAGFVTLPSTLSSRSNRSCPSTPSSAAFTVSAHDQPTPSAPPNFPPIMFISPTVVTAAPMWEYQRERQWSLTSMEQQGAHSSNSSRSGSSAGSSEFTPGPKQGFAFTPSPRPEYSPASSSSPPDVQASRRPAFQPSSSSSGSDSFGSSSTFASGISSSTSLSSVEETDEDVLGSRSSSSKGKARAIEIEPTEYPFPTGRDSPRSHGSRGSRASSATASPTIIGAAAPATFPVPSASTRRQDLQPTKLPSPRRRRRSSEGRRDRAKKETAAAPKPALPPTPTFATAKRPSFGRQYSLTELCSSSPFVWLSNSDMFAPPAPITRSPVRTTASSILSTPAGSRPPPPVDPPHPPPPTRRHRRHHTIADGRTHHSDPSGRVHRIPSAPIRMPTIPSEPGSSPDRGSVKSRKADRKAKEREATLGGKAADTQAGPDPTDPHGLSASHGQSATAGRGRDTRGKMLGASESVEERAAAQAEVDMDKEKAEALDGLAALALAHKEREFEYARNIVADRERTRVLKQKQRAHHKLRDRPLQEEPASESEITMVDQQATAVKIVH